MTDPTLRSRLSTIESKLIDTDTRIGGYTVAPKVDSFVRLDGRQWGENLLAGDDFTCSGYEGCDFRYPMNPAGPIKSVSINVKITGRTSQVRYGSRWVRVRIEWVRDCEPSSFSGGWMAV